MIPHTINTSNAGKISEFTRLFAQHSVIPKFTNIDLPEIIADPLRVITHKASSIGEDIIVEDTSLDIEGAEIGINVKWLLDTLTEHIGKKATAITLLAFMHQNQVYVYEGKVHGTIVAPRGAGGFGYDSIFLPDGHNRTSAEDKPDSVNPRALAIEALFANRTLAITQPITTWDGNWQ